MAGHVAMHPNLQDWHSMRRHVLWSTEWLLQMASPPTVLLAFPGSSGSTVPPSICDQDTNAAEEVSCNSGWHLRGQSVAR